MVCDWLKRAAGLSRLVVFSYSKSFMMRNVLLLVLFPALIHATLSQTHVFYFVPENMSWSEAQTHCRQHYTDLATIDDLTDHLEFVETLRAGVGAEWIWTGLYRTDDAAPWIWSDRSGSAFRPWEIGQPNNNGGSQFCARTSLMGTFNDGECDLKYPAVCYNKRRTQTLRLMLKSSPNVNDSEVKKHILSMIEQMLMEKGLTEDVKLTYRNQSDGNVFQKGP